MVLTTPLFLLCLVVFLVCVFLFLFCRLPFRLLIESSFGRGGHALGGAGALFLRVVCRCRERRKQQMWRRWGRGKRRRRRRSADVKGERNVGWRCSQRRCYTCDFRDSYTCEFRDAASLLACIRQSATHA